MLVKCVPVLCCWFEVAADGNWIHIHYQSKLQAKKVLSKNGKVFGGSIMVGVAPCIDKVGTATLCHEVQM